MRRLLHNDVVAAARVLTGHPEARWARVLFRMRAEACRAQAWRVAKGRQHPLWGDGSLCAAALRRRPVPEPALSDGVYRRALVFVLTRAFPD